MAEVNFSNISSSSIQTPSAGVSTIYFDTDKSFRRKIDTGYVNMYQNGISTSAQSLTAAARTYIAGTNVKVSSVKLQQGSMFRWKFNMTKTAAGIAASTFDIAFGTLGTTGDTARVSFTKTAGTAVADEGWVEITCIIRSIGVGGVAVGNFQMTHNLAATGHALVPIVVVTTVSAAFDMTTVTNVGVCATTGAADAITIQMVTAEWWDV